MMFYDVISIIKWPLILNLNATSEPEKYILKSMYYIANKGTLSEPKTNKVES